MSTEPTFQHGCTICGQVNLLAIGELHDCPGSPGLFPPTKFEPMYSAGYRLAMARNKAFWDAFLKGSP